MPSSQYDNLSVDPELAAKVASLFETGMWSSKRALYHDLIRRGLMEVLASTPTPVPVPSASPPPAPTAVPSVGSGTADAPAEPSASHRPRSRSGRLPRPSVHAEKEHLSPANPVGAGAASAEAVEPSTPPTAVPGTTRDGGASSAPATSAQAVDVRAEATWTCPACKGTFPLEERWVHKPECPATPPPGFEVPKVKCGRCGQLVETTSAAREAHFKICPPDAGSAPATSRVDTERLRNRVHASLRDAGRSSNPRAYLIALVQRAVEDQRLPQPPDSEADRMVEDLARRDPEVARVLRRVVT